MNGFRFFFFIFPGLIKDKTQKRNCFHSLFLYSVEVYSSFSFISHNDCITTGYFIESFKIADMIKTKLFETIYYIISGMSCMSLLDVHRLRRGVSFVLRVER